MRTVQVACLLEDWLKHGHFSVGARAHFVSEEINKSKCVITNLEWSITAVERRLSVLANEARFIKCNRKVKTIANHSQSAIRPLS